jgi:hypothetical protein
MTATTDPRVDSYIDSLPGWQQAICREVRGLVHAADPEVTETIKRTRLPYFVLQGNICALLAAKDHVNVFLYDGAIVPDPEGIITGVPAHHRQQPGRRLAQAQAPVLTGRHGSQRPWPAAVTAAGLAGPRGSAGTSGQPDVEVGSLVVVDDPGRPGPAGEIAGPGLGHDVTEPRVRV